MFSDTPGDESTMFVTDLREQFFSKPSRLDQHRQLRSMGIVPNQEENH